ncbi:hypothetical protein VOLCADRAFT_87184 [Volvox carteri f. nagariensis]|uniref:Uncharacterized protein n=1 Tax=Volvox carteri f. nagariensis TaxID=3068 RepID=D8TKE2_VOLCA|nr:uncharacterized protein VOLCADRAFT_87184 [Volvox carteri f. nagariensis]EFJ52045.1 hypothetical protein VOLCADRAFT_87184 [Volvox carteri f. nagariensis]|eukprot:XP_002946819.1 hypothetical protein VOLCADRAFT_87184 [Volvox carteri f. nagariensis]
MKVKARQRGARNSAGQSQHDAAASQNHNEQLISSSQELPLTSGRGDGSTSNAAAGGSSTAASGHSTKAAQGSATSLVPAAASRPPLVIGTTSAAARPTPPSRALTQQQLRKQRQQQRNLLPPVRARGGRQAARDGPRGAAAATSGRGGISINSRSASFPSAPSAAELDAAVRAVERALEDGPVGRERLQAMSVEQPDLYSQVILALFQKTQSLELISKMPMPMIPEPDFLLEPPLPPGPDYEDLDLAWDEGEEGDELDRWEAMMAAAGEYGNLYDMPYDLDGVDAPFPVEPPFPDFDYEPEFDDDDYGDMYEDEYESEMYDDEGDEEDGEDGEEGDGLGYLENKAGEAGEGSYLDGEDKEQKGGVEQGEWIRQEFKEYGKYDKYGSALETKPAMLATGRTGAYSQRAADGSEYDERPSLPYTTTSVHLDAVLGTDPAYDCEGGLVSGLRNLHVTGTSKQPPQSPVL